MNNGIKFIFAFSLGAAAGSVVTWKLIKTKYEQIAQDEIDSVKEVFSERMKNIENEPTEGEESASAEVKIVNVYNSMTEPYKSDSNKEEKGGSESMKKYDESIPYVISPSEFDIDDVNEVISLNYYADGVLADDMDGIVEDIANTVGLNFYSHFGEFEEDTVYIRNDRLGCNYEICRDCRKYSDLNPTEEE